MTLFIALSYISLVLIKRLRAARYAEAHSDPVFVRAPVYAGDELPAGEVKHSIHDGQIAVYELQARHYNRLGQSRRLAFSRHLIAAPGRSRRPKYDDCLNLRQLQPERLTIRQAQLFAYAALSPIANTHGVRG